MKGEPRFVNLMESSLVFLVKLGKIPDRMVPVLLPLTKKEKGKQSLAGNLSPFSGQLSIKPCE